jgi:hypothetical protein
MLELHDIIVDQLLNPHISFCGLNPTFSSIPKSSYKLPSVHVLSGPNYAKENNNVWE